MKNQTPKFIRTSLASPIVIAMARILLEPGCLYHIYNHAVGKDKLSFGRKLPLFLAPV